MSQIRRSKAQFAARHSVRDAMMNRSSDVVDIQKAESNTQKDADPDSEVRWVKNPWYDGPGEKGPLAHQLAKYSGTRRP